MNVQELVVALAVVDGKIGEGKQLLSRLRFMPDWRELSPEAADQLRTVRASLVEAVRRLDAIVGDDAVNPKHYDGDACMRAIAELGYAAPFCLMTVLKYIWRAGRKSSEKTEIDCAKAQWYLDWLDQHREDETIDLVTSSPLYSMLQELKRVVAGKSSLRDEPHFQWLPQLDEISEEVER